MNYLRGLFSGGGGGSSTSSSNKPNITLTKGDFVSSSEGGAIYQKRDAKGKKFYFKVFFPDETDVNTVGAYLKELFVLNLLDNNNEPFCLKKLGNGDDFDNEFGTNVQNDLADGTSPKTKKRLTTWANKFPYIVLEDAGESLSDWIITQHSAKPIAEDDIKSIAFQLCWVMSKLNSTYGIMHHDLHEKNIAVTEITDGKPLVFVMDNSDVFTLKTNIRLTLIDYGSVSLRTDQTPDDDPNNNNLWRQKSEIALQTYLPPEVWFRQITSGTEYKDWTYDTKSYPADAYCIGNIILSLLAHNRLTYDGKVFEYKQYNGVILFDYEEAIKNEDPRLVRIDQKQKKRTIKKTDEDGVYKQLFRPEESIFTNSGLDGKKVKISAVKQLFYVRLLQIQNALFENKASDPNVIFPETPEGVKKLVKHIKDSKFDTEPNVFDSLIALSESFGLKLLLQRLMHLDPAKRLEFGLPGQKYLFTGGVFHPYFSEYHTVLTNSTLPSDIYTKSKFLQPLPYIDDDDKDKEALTTMIQDQEKEFRQKFVDVSKKAVKPAEKEEEEEEVEEPESPKAKKSSPPASPKSERKNIISKEHKEALLMYVLAAEFRIAYPNDGKVYFNLELDYLLAEMDVSLSYTIKAALQEIDKFFITQTVSLTKEIKDAYKVIKEETSTIFDINTNIVYLMAIIDFYLKNGTVFDDSAYLVPLSPSKLTEMYKTFKQSIMKILLTNDQIDDYNLLTKEVSEIVSMLPSANPAPARLEVYLKPKAKLRRAIESFYQKYNLLFDKPKEAFSLHIQQKEPAVDFNLTGVASENTEVILQTLTQKKDKDSAYREIPTAIDVIFYFMMEKFVDISAKKFDLPDELDTVFFINRNNSSKLNRPKKEEYKELVKSVFLEQITK